MTVTCGVTVTSRQPRRHLGQNRGRTPQEQEIIQREIESTDRAIDRLVYELYGLSEEEIKIIEGN